MVLSRVSLLKGWLVRRRVKRERRGALRAFIASSGRRSAATVDRLFFRVYFSAYFHVFNTVARNFCPSFRPLALRPLLSSRHIASPLALSPSQQRVARASIEAFATRDKRVCDRDCRRETGGTRPAAIPRYTNLLAKLAKLARGFWNSKMARISA